MTYNPGWTELGWSEEITDCWEHGPRKRQAKMLDRALELVQSVPYNVTLRWLFYALWQEGWFAHKKPSQKADEKELAYVGFIKLMSRLRQSPYELQERWPIELADDRRNPIYRTEGFITASEWLEEQQKQVNCVIDKMVGQERYVIVAFEAEAMQSQFEYLTKPYGVNLWPFSGSASIPYKKRIARFIEWAYKRLGLPVIILYFGDYDEKGIEIPETAFRHIRKWCAVPFEAYRAGLNAEHITQYNIVEAPERPGKYQWEAVNRDAAKEIVTLALDGILHRDAITQVEEGERGMTDKVRQALASIEVDYDE